MRPSKLLFEEIVLKILPVYSKEEAKSIAFMLFEQFTGFTKTDILVNKILVQNYDFNPLIERLLHNEPIQYIIGNTFFLGNKFLVDKGITLIPRPETEELVLLAIEKLKLLNRKNRDLNILDIGTGSGCIAISIAKAIENAMVKGWDISENALKYAEINAKLNGVEVSFEKQNILEWQGVNNNKYDLIISNPPYVTMAEKSRMDKNVLDYEPHIALFVSDEEPLLFYKKIGEFASKNLNDNGILLFEINEHFGFETKNCLFKLGFRNCTIIQDIHGKDRIILAYS